MALITVQRSSSSSSLCNSEDDVDLSRTNVKSITESFFVVKGAALILRKNECHMSRYLPEKIHDIRQHLHSMFSLVRPQDKITLAIRIDCNLTCSNSKAIRYVALVSSCDHFDAEEYGLIGFDLVQGAISVGLVMPIYSDLVIKLNGDGGLKLFSNDDQHIIRPVTVQAMWSAFQALNKAATQARICNFYPGGISHTWMQVYRAPSIRSNETQLNEWSLSDEIVAYRSESPVHSLSARLDCDDTDEAELLQKVKVRLKDIMTTVDLDEVTSKYLRERLEEEMGIKLSEYLKFIDDAILQVFAHMDKASHIMENLFLGSEWNASNYEELKDRNVEYILNVSKEIDNFFPEDFTYMNIRVQDTDNAELIREWEKTYKYISNARENGKACLVHCKMGISRSAATVVAYLMKEFGWNLDKAFNFVRQRRNCVRPNPGFMEQLRVYEGILQASQIKRKLFEQTKGAADSASAESSGNRCNNPLFANSATADMHCFLANGTDYIIRRFLDSVREYWSNRDLAACNAAADASSSFRMTKPDQSWIRARAEQCIPLMKRSEDNRRSSLRAPDRMPFLFGSVKKRVRALESRTSSVPGAFLSRNSGERENTAGSKLNRIQKLIRMYSFGLDDSMRGSVSAFHSRLFDSNRRSHEIQSSS